VTSTSKRTTRKQEPEAFANVQHHDGSHRSMLEVARPAGGHPSVIAGIAIAAMYAQGHHRHRHKVVANECEMPTLVVSCPAMACCSPLHVLEMATKRRSVQ